MRLSTKVISLMTLMAVLTGLIVGGVTLNLMGRTFDEYLTRTKQQDIGQWQEFYVNYYSENGNSWVGVQNAAENAFQNFTLQSSNGVMVVQREELSVVLVSPEGTVLTLYWVSALPSGLWTMALRSIRRAPITLSDIFCQRTLSVGSSGISQTVIWKRPGGLL